MAEPEKKDDDKKVDEIKLDDKKESFSKDEVKALLEKTANEIKTAATEATKSIIEIEKKKLYDTIESEKKKASDLEKKLKDKEKAEDDKKKEEDDKKKSEMDALQRVEILEKTQVENSQRFEEVINLKDAEYKAELQKRDLMIYKEKLIAGYNGAIIPEMVLGKTEEELKVAADLASQRYKEIAERSKQEILDENVKKGILPKPGDLDHSLKKASGAKDWQDVMSMPKEDFAAYKKSVLDSLEK